jgi:hypothetical protein
LTWETPHLEFHWSSFPSSVWSLYHNHSGSIGTGNSDTFLEDFPVSFELFSSTTSSGFQELDPRILGRLLICPEDQKMSNRIPSASISIDNK